MTQADYNQHVTRAAVLMVGLYGSKATAKANLASTLSGTRTALLGALVDSVGLLRMVASVSAVAGMPPGTAVSDAAWTAHLADVAAKIDSMP